MEWPGLFILFGVVAAQFMIVPLVGAALLFGGFHAIGMGERLTFARSWKAYFAAVCCGLGIVMLLNVVTPALRPVGLGSVGTQIALVCLAHFVVVLFWVRAFSWRALLVQGGGVVMTNCVAFALVYAASAK